MKRSNRLILLIGVFLAALAFVFIIVLLSGSGNNNGSNGPSAPPSKLPTVIATRAIPLGVTVQKDMVTVVEKDIAVRLPGAFGDASQVVGNVARQAIAEGAQVTAAAFSSASGATNLTVPAGFSAIAVQVDQLSGVGTLIKNGDYVDIVATIGTSDPRFPLLSELDVTRVPDENYDHTSVKVLIQGLQVVGTLLPPPPAPAAVASGAPPADTGTTSLNGQQEIVILAVTQQQAEVVKFLMTDGSITLTLRSPFDFVDVDGNPIVPEAVVTTGIVLKTMITDWGVIPPEVIVTLQPTPQP